MRGVLNPNEVKRFARIAWSMVDSGDPPLPAGTTIYPHFWTRLPFIGHDARTAAGARVFDTVNGTMDPNQFQMMTYAVRSSQLSPTEAQARNAFDALAALRPPSLNPDDLETAFDFGMRGYQPEEVWDTAGLALTWGLAPSLAVKDRTRSRLAAVEAFVAQPHGHSAMGAIVAFLPRHRGAGARLETLIRRGLMAQETRHVAAASDALRLWFAHAGDQGVPPLPGQLLEQLIGVIEVRQSPALWHLLRASTKLVRLGVLTAEHRSRLEVALGDLLIETDYSRIPIWSELAGNVSLVRANAVLLAAELGKAGATGEVIAKWRLAGENDPLPEVRHATYNDDD